MPTTRRFPPDDPKLSQLPGARKKHRPTVLALAEDMKKNGQLQWGKVAPMPDGRFGIIIGNHRAEACWLAGLDFIAEALDEMPSPSQVIQMRVGENSKRKNASAFEICDDLTAYMALQPRGTTWAKVGEDLGIPPGTLNRFLGPKRIPLNLRPFMEGFGLTIVQIIAKAPTIEGMKQAIEFVRGGPLDEELPDDSDRPRVTKEMVELFLKRLTETRGRKPGTLKGKIGGRDFTTGLKPEDKGNDLIAFHEEAIKRLNKYRDAPAGSLSFLFA